MLYLINVTFLCSVWAPHGWEKQTGRADQTAAGGAPTDRQTSGQPGGQADGGARSGDQSGREKHAVKKHSEQSGGEFINIFCTYGFFCVWVLLLLLLLSLSLSLSFLQWLVVYTWIEWDWIVNVCVNTDDWKDWLVLISHTLHRLRWRSCSCSLKALGDEAACKRSVFVGAVF